MSTHDAVPSLGETATTSRGGVRGETRNGVEHYWGIPCAAAPVGELRFARPAEHRRGRVCTMPPNSAPPHPKIPIPVPLHAFFPR